MKPEAAYFNLLQDDFNLLQLRHANPYDTIDTTGELARMLRSTQRIGNIDGYNYDEQIELELATELGHMTASLCASKDLAFSRVDNSVCPEAEPRLLANLAETPNPRFRSPLIVTYDDEPVAIAKSYGEETIHALSDDKHLNLFENTICKHDQLEQINRVLEPSDQAFWIDAASLERKFNNPYRISAFAVPADMRRNLIDDTWITYEVKHDKSDLELGKMVTRLLESAAPAIINQSGKLQPAKPDRKKLILT